MSRIVEVCCGSYQDAINAYNGGAKRIELNSALSLGGLTSSIGTLRLVKRDTDLTVMSMVRNRGAGFLYSDNEYRVMFEDAKLLLDNGSDGIVFGFLDSNFNIDYQRTKEFVSLIKSYNKIAVFHRAFDCVLDPYKSIETLIELGIDRVLTSGLKARAIDGMELIKDLQDKYGSKIEILVGSGINANNASTIIDYTGVYQVHSSCKGYQEDLTTSNNGVNYSYIGNSSNYEEVDIKLVKELINNVKQGDNDD